MLVVFLNNLYISDWNALESITSPFNKASLLRSLRILVLSLPAILFKIEENDYIIGYKYDKLVYEVKEKKDDGFNYIYYDAISGEMINKIYLDN